MITPIIDKIVFSPADVDMNYSPLRSQLNTETYVLGAFNPGMTRLPNGNMLLMVRIAESLSNPESDNMYKVLRWSKEKGYVYDLIPTDSIVKSDLRKIEIVNLPHKTFGLTSLSWLLPVEFSVDGLEIVRIHYDKIIQPEDNYQEYGIEDPRITKIENRYYMTACAVSSYRHSTILYSSSDGLNYDLHGIILDHQNKDMVLFPQKINGLYYALTRPVGENYLISPQNSLTLSGPSMFMAQSPDLLHWKPVEKFAIQPKLNSLINLKLGGGAQPVLTDNGWLVLFHGVEDYGAIGKYRTFKTMLNKYQPYNIEYIDIQNPVLESCSKLSIHLENMKYVDDVVFTTGIEEYNDVFILASGELDLCCRITHFYKSALIHNNQ